MESLGQRAAGIILAAGTSTRMGKPKQLLPIRGQTLLGRLIDEALKSDLDSVILVLGHEAEAIRSSLKKKLDHPKLEVIENRIYKKGISTSIIAGLREADKSSDQVMILLADMPHIDSRLINLLLHRYLDSNLPLGAVEIRGKRSHPVIFNRTLYPQLYRLTGDRGARELFRQFRDRVCLVEPSGSYNDKDIDTWEDYVSHSVSQIP